MNHSFIIYNIWLNSNTIYNILPLINHIYIISYNNEKNADITIVCIFKLFNNIFY